MPIGGVVDINYLIASVIAVSGVCFAYVKYLQTDVEKKQKDLDAEVEKEKLKVDAEVEKERLRSDADIAKAKEKAMGAEAVAKMWKELDEMKDEIERLTQCRNKDHANDMVLNEIINRLKEDYEKILKILFDTFKR